MFKNSSYSEPFILTSSKRVMARIIILMLCVFASTIVVQAITTSRISSPQLENLVLTPVADVFVASGFPDASLADRDNLWVGYDQDLNFLAQRTLLKFDLSAIESGSTIHSAKLFLYSESSSGDNDPMRVELYKMNGDWPENTTWNNHLGLKDEQVIDQQEIPTSDTLVSWDIRSLAQQWVNGQTPNHGVILLGDESPGQHERGFWSKECVNKNCGPEELPRLEIQFDRPAPIPLPTAAPTNTPIPTATPMPTPIPTPVPLELSLEAEPDGEVARGEIITYIITYKNIGDQQLEGVKIIGGVPRETSFNTTPDGDFNEQEEEVSWDVGQLEPNETQTKVYSVIVNESADLQLGKEFEDLESGELTSTTLAMDVSQNSAQDDPKLDNNDGSSQSEIQASPEIGDIDLEVKKEASSNSVTAGDRLTYTITITNTGPLDATNITLSDTLPMSLTLLTTSLKEECQADDPSLVGCTFGNLENGDQISTTFVVDVLGNTQGIITNTVTVGAQENDLNLKNNRSTISTQIQTPSEKVLIAHQVQASYLDQNNNRFPVSSNVVFNGEPLKLYLPLMARHSMLNHSNHDPNADQAQLHLPLIAR